MQFRAYKVNADDRQFHKPVCSGSSAVSMPTIGTVQSTIQDVTFDEDGEETAVAPASPGQAADGLAALIASVVAPLLPKPEATVNEETVRRIVAAEFAADGSRHITVSVAGSGKAPISVGRQHMTFPDLLHLVSLRENVYLVGSAGTGKTTAGHMVSKALDLRFGSMSVFEQMPASNIFGYRDTTGRYHDTEFRRRFEHGGVFLFDEIDHGDANTLGAINQAIENGHCAFPDGMIERHPDFVVIAAANTYGRGADREYVGAFQMDGATRDRFTFLAWDIDEQFEWDLASATYAAHGGADSYQFVSWIAKVRLARSKAAEHKIRHVVSPRASIKGAKLLASGMAESKVADMVLWKGLDVDAQRRLS